MVKSRVTFIFLFLIFWSNAQEISLPVDFRQHGLTEYNRSLLHPVFSLNGREDETVSLWSRWQWQPVDTDPTNIFLSYRRKINYGSALGVSFFQHNTERYLKTGGILNYAYAIEIRENLKMAFGLNLIGFKHKLTETTFQPGSLNSTGNDFVLQMAPGLLLSIYNFNIGLTSENSFTYNFSTKGRHFEPADRIFLGLASYDFAIGEPSNGRKLLRPTLYFKTIPGFDNQIGLNALFTADKFWAQTGYNSHYGISGGIGGRFFKKFAVGVLMEFGTDSNLKGLDPTFEIVSAFDFGGLDERKKLVGFDVEEKDETLEEQLVADIIEPEQNEPDNLELENQRRQKDSVAANERRVAQNKLDSITRAKEQEATAQQLLEQRKQDSLARLELAEKEALKKDELRKLAEAEAAKKEELKKVALAEQAKKPKPNEKYEEVATEDGLEPGYYLIANVFGTKKYFEAFMKDLRSKGLQPKSFFRSLNKFNYVYLKRYDTMSAARKARDGNFSGRYGDKTWIFRVIGD